MAARSSLSIAFSLGVLLLTGPSLEAQLPVVEGPLPPEVVSDVIDMLNDPAVLRFTSGSRIPAGSRVEGDVAVLGGSLDLGGEIAGRVLVVNGDLALYPSTVIEGGAVVVGGVVTGGGADDPPGVVVYSAPLRYRISGGRIEPTATDGGATGAFTSDLGFGQARVAVRAGPAYNRVEGLPVRFGGIIRTEARNPQTLEAFGIWRSVSGLHLESDRLGHAFQLTQGVGGRGTAAIGMSLRDEIVAIEDQGFSGLEASLATFFLKEDLRDYFRRDGWSVFATFNPGRPPLEAILRYREEEHRTAPLRSPWTVRDENDPWRILPLVAEGTSKTVEAQLRWDSRDDSSFPADGWLVDLAFEREVGGSLRLPDSGPAVGEPVDPPEPPLASAARSQRFMRGTLDVRRYARVGPGTRLRLRAFATGSLDGTPLPPQFQSALGGEGNLPGHRRFAIDCGARSSRRFARTGEGDESRTIQPVFPAYGCDRTILFQAELQGALPFLGNPLPDSWEDSELATLFNLQPVWSIFLDAGQGWELGDLGNNLPRASSGMRADVGVGLFLGPFGFYWAYPLNHQDLDLNFFVRFQERF